jgi:hypothetical protein
MSTLSPTDGTRTRKPGPSFTLQGQSSLSPGAILPSASSHAHHRDPTGYSWHGDFQNGWNQEVLQNAISNCNNPSNAGQFCLRAPNSSSLLALLVALEAMRLTRYFIQIKWRELLRLALTLLWCPPRPHNCARLLPLWTNPSAELSPK